MHRINFTFNIIYLDPKKVSKKLLPIIPFGLVALTKLMIVSKPTASNITSILYVIANT